MNVQNKELAVHFFGRCLRWVAVSCAVLVSDVCVNADDHSVLRDVVGQKLASGHTSVGRSAHGSSASANIDSGSKSGAWHNNAPARSAIGGTKVGSSANAVVTSSGAATKGGVDDGVVTITGTTGRSVADAAGVSANSIYPGGSAGTKPVGGGFGSAHPGSSSVGGGDDITSGAGQVDVTDPGLPGGYAGGADAGLSGDASLDVGGGADLTSGPAGGAGSLAGFAFAGRSAGVWSPRTIDAQLVLNRLSMTNDTSQSGSVQIVPKGAAQSPMTALLLALGWIGLVVGIGWVQRGSGSTRF